MNLSISSASNTAIAVFKTIGNSRYNPLRNQPAAIQVAAAAVALPIIVKLGSFLLSYFQSPVRRRDHDETGSSQRPDSATTAASTGTGPVRNNREAVMNAILAAPPAETEAAYSLRRQFEVVQRFFKGQYDNGDLNVIGVPLPENVEHLQALLDGTDYNGEAWTGLLDATWFDSMAGVATNLDDFNISAFEGAWLEASSQFTTSETITEIIPGLWLGGVRDGRSNYVTTWEQNWTDYNKDEDRVPQPDLVVKLTDKTHRLRAFEEANRHMAAPTYAGVQGKAAVNMDDFSRPMNEGTVRGIDTDLHEDTSFITAAFHEMARALETGETVVAHCSSGKDRSPAFVEMFLHWHLGVSKERAANWVMAKRGIVGDMDFTEAWKANFDPNSIS